MSIVRIALANLAHPETPDNSVRLAEEAIAGAAAQRADIVCFPECYVPGYRSASRRMPPPDPDFLERAWTHVAEAAARGNIGVILGTERFAEEGLVFSALVINRDGTRAGFQDKMQIDPSEEGLYVGARPGRHLFRSREFVFGIAICHEGFRYPETVRWPARHGAHVVFHPHFYEAIPGGPRPTTFLDPANTFHEKAAICRAAENTCYFATVNYASEGSPTTSAVIRPDGTVLAWQPYGKADLLVADIDTSEATRLLATRCKSYESNAPAERRDDVRLSAAMNNARGRKPSLS